MEWKNNIQMTSEEEKQVISLRAAGCKCELPLLGGYGKSIRCRLCGVEIDSYIKES